jgi:hypothetical protein
MIVRARSPYIIFINEVGQTSGKLELRIWKKGETKPTLPNYSFTKSIPSPTQKLLRFNISPYLKDFISNKLNDVNTWYCNFECRLFSNNIELTAQKVEGIAVNGYTTFLQGQNYSESNANRFSNIKRHIPIDNTNKLHYYNRSLNEISEITATNVEETCEPILEPQLVRFVNRYGGLDFIWFFKMRTDSISTESKDYKLLQQGINYDTIIGQNAKYNFNGKQSIKMNTGFVPENYDELIQDLMLSEKVWINSIPAIVKSTGTEFKTQIRNKNINYEIEFEYAFDLINNMQ